MIVNESNFGLKHGIKGNIIQFLYQRRALKPNKLTDSILSWPFKFDVMYPKAFARSR